MFPLDCLRSNEWAEVTDVDGDPRWVARLADVGLRAGVRLQMLQPGSPCLCEVGATRLSLRLDEHLQVFVRPLVAGLAAVGS
ncbi:MAG TPA: FeoA family protein [Gemmatales bacterium]|nr:FeoA family protein [Gemmatales bacterium]HMP60608.1 FeoA family protein [Gemmatales bacterium]